MMNTKYNPMRYLVPAVSVALFYVLLFMTPVGHSVQQALGIESTPTVTFCNATGCVTVRQ